MSQSHLALVGGNGVSADGGRVDAVIDSPGTPSIRKFLIVQAGIWSAYGALLMLPWLDRFSVAMMLPNKAFIAASGVLVSFLLRTGFIASHRLGLRRDQRLVLAVPAALLAGVMWNAATVVALGAPSEGLFSLGTLSAGVPLLGGTLYHSMLMLAWALGYLAITEPRTVLAAPASVLPERINLRDGARTVVLAPSQISWIEADGDYVRVHGPEKPLLLRYTMSGILETLPGRFLRVHRSAIVNVDRVRELRPQPNREFEVLLDDGARTKASRTYSAALASHFARHR